MKTSERSTRELAKQIRAELSAPGATAQSVACSHGISRRTLYRVLDVLSTPEKPSNAHVEIERAKLPQGPLSPVISESEAVAIIAGHITAGTWKPTDFERYRSLWNVRRLTMRDLVVDAHVRVRASIDPHYLSALFVDSVRHLRYLAARAEREKKTGLAIEATSRAAMLIATVSRANHVRNVGASEQRLDTTEKLIAAGWTPPAPDGLPMPTVDDPNEGSEGSEDGKA